MRQVYHASGTAVLNCMWHCCIIKLNSLYSSASQHQNTSEFQNSFSKYTKAWKGIGNRLHGESQSRFWTLIQEDSSLAPSLGGNSSLGVVVVVQKDGGGGDGSIGRVGGCLVLWMSKKKKKGKGLARYRHVHIKDQ